MQLGVCISPPFPRTEEVCHSNTTVDKDGYYYEQHNFDYIDYAKLNSPRVLQEQFQLRQARIANCTHLWDPAEMRVIMKRVENMTHGGFG